MGGDLLATKYILVIIMYILAYVYSIILAPKLTANASAVNRMHESCIVGCGSVTKPLTTMRGSQYIIGGDPAKNAELGNCFITFWGLAHFALYYVLGIIAPDMFWETFAIGVGFELYENYKFDCHDLLDIGLNSAGFIAGRHSRKLVARLCK